MILPDINPDFVSSSIAILIAAIAWTYLYYRKTLWSWFSKKKEGE